MIHTDQLTVRLQGPFTSAVTGVYRAEGFTENRDFFPRCQKSLTWGTGSRTLIVEGNSKVRPSPSPKR